MKINYKVGFIGGHFTPAEAMIQEILKPEYGIKKDELIFFGRRREAGRNSFEYLTINSYGIKFVNAWAVKFNRFITFKNLINFLLFPLTIIFNLVAVLRFRPKVMLGFGGYISIPVCLAAKIWGVKVFIYEGTIGAGLANRIISKFANEVFISFEDSYAIFPKAIHIGPLLRQEILEAKCLSSRIPMILISGGHQGSKALNAAIMEAVHQLLPKYLIVHQVGSRDAVKVARFKDSLPNNLKVKYIVKDFFNAQEYAKYLANCSLVISRCGINTIAEIIYLQKKAILIPFEHTQLDEQKRNASFAVRFGRSMVIRQKDLTADNLLQKIEEIQDLREIGGVDFKATWENAAKKIIQEMVNELN